MQPQQLSVNLGDEQTRNLIGDLTIENRALRCVLVLYMDRYGPLAELASAQPAEISAEQRAALLHEQATPTPFSQSRSKRQEGA
jgi:hypothetical protein